MLFQIYWIHGCVWSVCPSADIAEQFCPFIWFFAREPQIWGMFWCFDGSARHGSAQTAVAARLHDCKQEPLTNIGPRSKPAKIVFLTPWMKEDSVCRGGDLVFIDLGFLFSQLCFLTHSLRSSWLHSAQSAQMHFGHHCNAPSTVMLWTAQFENGIYNNTICASTKCNATHSSELPSTLQGAAESPSG